MLSSNIPVRVAFSIAVLLNLFIVPWWLTLVWCFIGCFLFPVYLEGIATFVLFDSVFVPGGVPVLSALVVTAVVLTSSAYYSTNYHVDFT